MNVKKPTIGNKILRLELNESDYIPILKKDYELLLSNAKEKQKNQSPDIDLNEIMVGIISTAIYLYCRHLDKEQRKEVLQ